MKLRLYAARLGQTDARQCFEAGRLIGRNELFIADAIQNLTRKRIGRGTLEAAEAEGNVDILVRGPNFSDIRDQAATVRELLRDALKALKRKDVNEAISRLKRAEKQNRVLEDDTRVQCQGVAARSF